MKQLDNYLVTLAMTVQKIGLPMRDDGWPAVPINGAAVAFHLGRFVYHAARIGGRCAAVSPEAAP